MSATVCSSVDRVKKVPTKGTSGKDKTYDVTPGVPSSAAGYENLRRPVRHGGQILDLQSGSGEAMVLEINHAHLGSQDGGD